MNFRRVKISFTEGCYRKEIAAIKKELYSKLIKQNSYTVHVNRR